MHYRDNPQQRLRHHIKWTGFTPPNWTDFAPPLTVVFAAAVHPEYQSRPAHGWFIRSDKPAIKATTGRQRLNLHGALDLETMKLTLVEGEKINAETSLRLFEKLERAYPDTRVIPGDPG